MKRRHFLSSLAAGTTLGAAMPPISGSPNPSSVSMKILLWCWDARMTWDDEPEKISTKMAVSDKKFPYPKRSESYRIGFRRLIDYCAEIGVEGIIVWGFLREGHGGVPAAQDLCKYARDKGVRILPGVGLCSYGGYFFEGDHPMNLDTYLREHPERASRGIVPGSEKEVAPVLDPSLPENQSWWIEGLEWMLDTFEVGGIDYEMGDFLVNPSARATEARKDLGIEADENILDSIVATQKILNRAFELAPEEVFINSTYRGFQQIRDFPRMPYVDLLPEKTVWQYALRSLVADPDFAEQFAAVPDHRMYGYLHSFNASTGTTDRDYSSEVARVFPGLKRLGFEFVGTYGEISARGNPVADRNYRGGTGRTGLNALP